MLCSDDPAPGVRIPAPPITFLGSPLPLRVSTPACSLRERRLDTCLRCFDGVCSEAGGVEEEKRKEAMEGRGGTRGHRTASLRAPLRLSSVVPRPPLPITLSSCFFYASLLPCLLFPFPPALPFLFSSFFTLGFLALFSPLFFLSNTQGLSDVSQALSLPTRT